MILTTHNKRVSVSQPIRSSNILSTTVFKNGDLLKPNFMQVLMENIKDRLPQGVSIFLIEVNASNKTLNIFGKSPKIDTDLLAGLFYGYPGLINKQDAINWSSTSNFSH